MDFSFQRCPHCFAPRKAPGVCPLCGERAPEPESLRPGTVLKGRYMAGDALSQTAQDIHYTGWDLVRDTPVEIAEYFPRALVCRDADQRILCTAGGEQKFEAGKQAFFERVKFFYECLGTAGQEAMDFFVRNGTCYYVRKARESAPAKETPPK